MITTAASTRRFCNLLSSFFIILVFGTILTVGLPIPRQEHDTGSDLIAGKAFLSLLMNSPRSNTPTCDDGYTTDRTPSSSPASVAASAGHSDQNDERLTIVDNRIPTSSDVSDDNRNINDKIEENPEGTVIAVRVSSTIGHSMINKHIYTHQEVDDNENSEIQSKSIDNETEDTEDITITDILQQDILKVTTPNIELDLGDKLVQDADQEAIASEDAPTIVAEANKSEFHVDEVEPISRDYNPSALPYQSTVIYHNEGSNTRARSVSYSTVIQALPTPHQKAWTPSIPLNTTNTHSMENPSGEINIPAQPQTQAQQGPSPSVAESKDFYVTAMGNDKRRNYETSSRYYSQEPTERNWGIPEQNYHEPSKPYTPIVYAQPEQNYEVDEAVSVETNGRAHGVQPQVQEHPSGGVQGTNGKKDDNQKVGYVVEGRNYRKYRVEERTSDGFIVGEYGVVRHDDGSLRGVRYTADGTISPRLIYDALMKFLSL